MSRTRRRRPVWGYRPTRNSTATTTFEGPSIALTAHWFPYEEDESGDFREPLNLPPVRTICGTSHKRVGCGCGPSAYWYAA